jgi:hypothetical protein
MSSLFNQRQVAWIANNFGTILKVSILMVLVTTFLVNPSVVHADPIMGGSVGKVMSSFCHKALLGFK